MARLRPVPRRLFEATRWKGFAAPHANVVHRIEGFDNFFSKSHLPQNCAHGLQVGVLLRHQQQPCVMILEWSPSVGGRPAADTLCCHKGRRARGRGAVTLRTGPAGPRWCGVGSVRQIVAVLKCRPTWTPCVAPPLGSLLLALQDYDDALGSSESCSQACPLNPLPIESMKFNVLYPLSRNWGWFGPTHPNPVFWLTFPLTDF